MKKAQYNKTLYEKRPSELEIPTYGTLNIKDDQSVHPEFPWKHCRRQASGTLLSSTMSDWGCILQFSTKLLSSAVARCGFVDMIHSRFLHDCAPPHFLLEVQEFWNSMFPEQWKGSRGLIAMELILLL
jgi:hypothetical protein